MVKNGYHKKESRWKKRLLAALGAFITACTVVLIPGCSGRQEEYPDGETEETTTADEEKNTVEEENRTEGRTPDVSRPGRNVCTYDPEDTIYYKTYYDDFVQGKIMHIDYTPRMEIRKELEDYFTDASGIRCLDNLAGMFYDDRTIETDEKELEQLFWEHGYLIDFCRGDFGDCHVRFVEITEMDGLSLYPVRILMQTWDEEHIYLQDITGPIPRKIKEVMTVERNGVRQLVVHSTGLSREYVAEEELSFWEQSGTCWILVPMELEIDVSHAHNMGSLYPDIDRESLYEAFFYRDGIAYRPSLQPFNKWGDRAVFRLGVMEIVEENKSFRLNAVCDVEGKTDLAYGYIRFEIAEKPEKVIAPTEEIVTDTPMGLAQYYGYYRITRFWPYDYYDALKYDRLPLEEADMMLGRIVEIQEDYLVTCDSFRSLGSRGGREAFDRNYNIERIAIESPNYAWEEFIPDTAWYEEFSEGHYFMEKPEERDWQKIEEEYYQGIEGKFSVLVAGPLTGRCGENEYYHEYYVKKDGILMYSELTGNFFYLEKLDGKPEGCEEDRGMTEEEKEIILQETLGIYTVTEFLPTKFYPGLDCAGDVYLPEKEADMMIGKEIIMESELYVTFNNGRWPNSEFMNRKMDDFILSRTEIEKPVYRIEERNRNDIYGLRDDMLPREMVQDRYMEISVYPGFGVNGKELPQLYLLHDGRIIMYAMSEYFLLEKQD